ncbi:hypothetical protein G9A89_014783 [Geosiphon pyriformis]|nr:hypothetical protein G9A89_014783 [Geosiphon pyriformis]
MTKTSTFIESSYHRGASQYIKIINDLRNLGAQHEVDLPTVVFCGNQSAGKSSLLEAISGVQLPRSDGTCTRCVMEIRLSADTSPWRCQVTLRREHNDFDNKPLSTTTVVGFGGTIDDPDDVESIARRAQKALLNPSRDSAYYLNYVPPSDSDKDVSENEIKFTKNVICLDIQGPDVPNLSLIDLPGIIQHTERTEDEKFIGLIQDLIQKYIQNEKSIIIATISCKDEIDNQAIVTLAKKVDEKGVRTLGVLTKPDTIESGTHGAWLKIMRGEKHKLSLGYYVVKNPSQEDLMKHITFPKARKAEKAFFEMHDSWKQYEFKNRIGVDNLRGKLSELLIEGIKRNLPAIKDDIEEKLIQTRKDLESIPEKISDNPRIEIFRMAKTCASNITDETRNANEKIEFWQKIGRELSYFKYDLCSTRPIFVVGNSVRFDTLEEFVNVRLNTQSKDSSTSADSDLIKNLLEKNLQEVTEAEVQRRLDDSKGRLLPGFIPYTAATTLIHDFQIKWKTPSDQCLSKVCEVLTETVEERLTESFGAFPKLLELMREHAYIWLDKCRIDTMSKMKFISSMEIGKYPFTLNDSEMSEEKLEYLNDLKQAVKKSANLSSERNNSSNCYDNLEVMAAVMSYFKISFKRYADNVAMTIIHSLIDQFSDSIEEKLLAPFFAEDKNDDDDDDDDDVDGSYKIGSIKELVEEDRSITQYREILKSREKNLHQLLTKLNRFGI